jgi:hypothetical protein
MPGGAFFPGANVSPTSPGPTADDGSQSTRMGWVVEVDEGSLIYGSVS